MNEKDESELNALVSLIDEPSEEIFEGIALKILSFGTAAIPVLLEKSENTFDSMVLQRLQEINYEIQFAALCADLEGKKDLDDYEMIEMCIRLARLEHYKVKEDDIRTQIEIILRDIWIQLNDQQPDPEKITFINHVIYDTNGFTGNTESFYDLKSAYLNTLLETHKGNAVSLGILYIIIARQLHLPVYGVDLPGQFILAFMDETEEGEGQPQVNDVRFYINPFYKGAIFSRKEVERYLMDIKVEPQEKYFLPCSNLDIISIHISELIAIYSKIDQKRKVKDLKKLLQIVNK